MTLSWWNVVEDRAETARIPAHRLTVVAAGPATATSSAAPAASAPASAASSAPAVSTAPAAAASAGLVSRHLSGTSAAYDSTWRRVALASLLLWLVSIFLVLAWWLRARRRHRPSSAPAAGQVQASPPARGLRLAFLAAARGGDPRATARTLLAWARSERSEVRHLAELAARLDDAAQQRAIEMLQRAIYAPGAADAGDPGDITPAFRKGLAWRRDPRRNEDEALPPLYPRRRD